MHVCFQSLNLTIEKIERGDLPFSMQTSCKVVFFYAKNDFLLARVKDLLFFFNFFTHVNH